MEILAIQFGVFTLLPVAVLLMYYSFSKLMKRSIFTADNSAGTIRKTGIVSGLTLGSIAIASNFVSTYIETGSLDFSTVLIYIVILFGALEVGRQVSNKVLLPGVNNRNEIEKGNQSIAYIEFSNFLSTGWIAFSAIIGNSPVEVTLAFLAAGQVIFILTMFFYELLSKDSLVKQIEEGDKLAGMKVAGWMIPLGVLLALSIAGDFIGWVENFTLTGTYFVFGLLTMIIFSFLVKSILFPGKFESITKAWSMLVIHLVFVLVVLSNLTLS